MRIVVGVLLAIIIGRAEAGPIRTVTLREAIGHARSHQPTLQAARARVAVARQQARLPRVARSTPRIVAGAIALVGTVNNTTTSYAGSFSAFVPRIGGTPASDDPRWAPEMSTLVGVGLTQDVYDFGRASAQGDALDLFARVVEEDAQLADLDLALYVAESFYAVAGAHAVLRASEAAVTRATAHRDFAQARVDAKLRPPIELARAEADLARVEVDRIRARGVLASSQVVLAAAIGAPEAAIDAGADDLAHAAVSALGTTDLDRLDPAVRAATAALHAQRRQTEAIELEKRPTIAFMAGITGRAGGAAVDGREPPVGNGLLPTVPNWNALLTVTWPLFDRTIDVRAATSRRLERVRTAELDAQRLRLRNVASQAFADLEIAQAAGPALDRAFEAARANQNQAEARFRTGLATVVELADAEALLTQAEIQVAIGRFQLARARARLARVVADRGEVP